MTTMEIKVIEACPILRIFVIHCTKLMFQVLFNAEITLIPNKHEKARKAYQVSKEGKTRTKLQESP